MLEELRQTFDHLEDKLERLLQELESMPPQTVNFKAGPDKWSVLEAVEHLVIAEEGMLEQLTTTGKADLDRQDRSAKNFNIVINVMERDIPVDVPDDRLEPHGEYKLEDLLDRWKAVRRKTRTYIEGIDSDHASALVYRHPFAGPLNIFETFRFIDVHFDNHIRHLETIKARAR